MRFICLCYSSMYTCMSYTHIHTWMMIYTDGRDISLSPIGSTFLVEWLIPDWYTMFHTHFQLYRVHYTFPSSSNSCAQFPGIWKARPFLSLVFSIIAVTSPKSKQFSFEASLFCSKPDSPGLMLRWFPYLSRFFPVSIRTYFQYCLSKGLLISYHLLLFFQMGIPLLTG